MIDYSLQDVNFAVTYNLQRTTNIYKSNLVFDIYILKPKSWLIEVLSRPVQNSYVCKL